MNLMNLPYDILLTIVAEFLSFHQGARPPIYSQTSYRCLWSLSLSCRLLHDVCSHWIYSTYRLLFRVSTVKAKYSPPLTLDEDKIFSGAFGSVEWEEHRMLRRIAHLASKVHHVRELCIEDCGQNEGLATFPRSAQETLAKVLMNHAVRLRIVHFKGERGPGPIIPALWDVLKSLEVKEMTLASILPPQRVDEMRCVDTLSLQWCEKTVDFLQVSLYKTSCFRRTGPTDGLSWHLSLM